MQISMVLSHVHVPGVSSWLNFSSQFLVSRHVISWAGKEIALIVSLLLVSIELINGFYVGRAWHHNDFKHLWTVKLLRATASALVTVLYIPILGSLYIGIDCANSFRPSFMCPVIVPITAVITIAFITMSTIVSATFFEYDPTNKSSPSARPHSRIDLVHLLIKTLLVLTSSFLSGIFANTNTPDSHNMFYQVWWVILTVSTSAVLAYLFTWYQPYYAARSNEMRAVLMCLVLWTAVAGPLATVALPFSGQLFIGPLLFGGYFLVIPLAVLTVRARRASLDAFDVTKCRNIYEFELCCRLPNFCEPSECDLAIVAKKFSRVEKIFPNEPFR